MKSHALAQREFPGERIGVAPGGEHRDRPVALIRVEERFENVVLRREVGLRRDEVRIERGDVGGEPDPQIGGIDNGQVQDCDSAAQCRR